MSTPEKQPKLGEAEFASKLVVALVDSPLTVDTVDASQIDCFFKVHFRQTRAHKLNDRIFVKTNGTEYQFKVVDVEPSELKNVMFNVNIEHTSLAQLEAPIKDSWIWTEPVIVKPLESYTNSVIDMINFHKYFSKSNEDTLPVLLLHGPSGSGKSRVVESVCSKLSLHLCQVNGVHLAGETAAAIERRVEIFLQNSINYGPCIIYIKSVHFVFKFRDLNECNKRMANTFFNIISRFKKRETANNKDFFIICACDSKDQIDANVLSNFNLELEVKNLNSEERKLAFTEAFCSDEWRIIEDDLQSFVKKTNGLYFGELMTLVDFVRQEHEFQKHETFFKAFQNALPKFEHNRKFKQENRLNIENVNWNDIGGLNEIKEIIMDTILLPLNYPSLFTSSKDKLGVSRSGILLYGPPGTGKTLLAKAICSQFELNFLSVKGPELLDMYVGQTELNIRNLFQKARSNAPCVLFFDELDSLAPIRGRSGDSGGVMDRVVSQLLTEIDGLDKNSGSSNNDSKSNQIFLIGATNRPDLIDPSLLRPGRLDKLVFVPVAKTQAERINIFQALTRKLKMDPKMSIEAFIEKCPQNLTGADFYAITNRARQNALKRIIGKLESEGRNVSEYEDTIEINEEDFFNVLDSFTPTLNESTLKDYEKYFIKYSQN